MTSETPTMPDALLEPDADATSIVAWLATAPDQRMSLQRLCQCFDVSASALLRKLTMMSDARLGGHAGPGWVRVEHFEERWIVHLTERGRSLSAAN